MSSISRASDSDAVAGELVARARDQQATLAVAESLTGGLIAAALTSVPGASEVFTGAVVAYTPAMKQDLLGVPEIELADHGIVSAWTAEAMARGALRVTNASHAVATTGVAGPGPADGIPAGRVCIAVVTRAHTTVTTHDFPGGRAAVRAAATEAALRHLLAALE